MQTGSSRSLSSYNPFDPQLLEDPFAYYASLRREAPVSRDTTTGSFMVSTYAAIAEIMKRGWAPVDPMLTTDAPERIVEFQHYFARKLEERRAEPRDDILSDLVNARSEGERPLDTAESLSIRQQLLVAGDETTASAIAEGMRLEPGFAPRHKPSILLRGLAELRVEFGPA